MLKLELYYDIDCILLRNNEHSKRNNDFKSRYLKNNNTTQTSSEMVQKRPYQVKHHIVVTVNQDVFLTYEMSIHDVIITTYAEKDFDICGSGRKIGFNG